MRYEPNHSDVGKILVSDEMGDAMEAAARAGIGYAQTIAPRETGEYAASFDVERRIDYGGRSPRVAVDIVNNADHAAAVEWGRTYVTDDGEAVSYDGHHILARTADFIENQP